MGCGGMLDESVAFSGVFWREPFKQRPLLGAGLGTFADLCPPLRADNFYSWCVWEYAHSTILEVAVEMGIQLAAMVVTAALASLFILARAAVKSEGRSRRSLAAITGIAVLSYLHSMIDFSLQIPGYLVLFGVLLGCGLARASTKSAEVTVRPLELLELLSDQKAALGR